MGVTSTHIYCRPGCPARLPDAERALLRDTGRGGSGRVPRVPEVPAGSRAGFAGCCRTAATVARALRLIDDGALLDGSLETLSDRLGVTSRWLRELFERHVGAAPLDVARTRQAHLARRLLEETPLPMEDVAAAAGYGSARRLRAAFQHTFRRAPATLRRRRARATEGGLALRLPARPPFDAAPTLAFLAGRAIAGVEEFQDGAYRRTFTLDGRPAVLSVHASGDGVELRLPAHAAAAVPRVLARVSRLFDLDADVTTIKAALERDARLARALRGRVVRVPGAFDAFEAGVRALLGQQVSVAAARTLAGRLVLACGVPLPEPDGSLTHVFPTPAAVAATALEKLGLTTARAAALRGFAAAVADGSLDLGAFRDLDDAVEKLTALPGSATGPRNTWRCARSASRTRSRPGISACGRHWTGRAAPERTRDARARRTLAPVAGVRRARAVDGAAEARAQHIETKGDVMTLELTVTQTPVGPMALYALGEQLVGLTLDGGHGAEHPVARHLARHVGTFTTRDVPDAAGAATRLQRYFAGDVAALDEQPVRMLGTPFQCDVWSALRAIPAGETRSYAALANTIHKPDAVRAVAAANGANRSRCSCPAIA
jgi:AraC family transcriptional regulator of adaptative response / DNA-3-methyladenine glycosylase II